MVWWCVLCDQCVTHVRGELVEFGEKGRDHEVLARPIPHVVAKLTGHEGSMVSGTHRPG